MPVCWRVWMPTGALPVHAVSGVGKPMKGSVFEHTSLLVEPIRALKHTITENDPLDPLFERIGDARIVMLGEASHGTHDYYTWRSKISQRLITEKGFNFIAI